MPASSRFPAVTGATVYDGGVTFRVWAPFAQGVHVAGEFNGWSETASPLEPEGGGYWSADVSGAAPRQNYKFVVGGAGWRIDPCARAVTTSVGDGLVYDPSFPWKNAFQMPPWNELVVYELHVGTFPDHPRDAASLLDAVIADLGYLQKLGVNAIELLPQGEFPGDSSWGYNPAHIFAVEHLYGGPDALKRLIDAAHGKGIAVILDVVYNHLGPNDLSVWQFDGWFERWQGEDMGGIYFYNDWRANTPWGRKNRPDYGRPEVRKYIRDNALGWLEEFRFDGLRFDSTVFIRNVRGNDGDPPGDANNLGGWGWNLLKWINDEVDAHQPWKLTIAEDMQDNPWITKPTSQGGAGFDSQWAAGFHHPVRDVLVQPDDRSRDMGKIRDALYPRSDAGATGRVVYTESHDEVGALNGKRRLTADIDPDHPDGWFARKRSTLGAALAFTAPGIPMICQGQEILESTAFGAGPINWDNYDRFRGIWQLYADLTRLRRNGDDRTRGLRGPHLNVFHVNDADKLIAFHRWENGGPRDDVVVVLNFANRTYPSYTLGLPRVGLWKVRFNSDWVGYADDFGNVEGYDTTAEAPGRDGLPCQGNVGIGPYTALILSQDA
jgi:1,4-alpha-glucan branching enzyme